MPFLRKRQESQRGGADINADTVSIASSQAETLVDDDATQRFTATGRPMPAYKPTAWGNMTVGFAAQVPQHLPHRFTDDSIIPVPVMLKSEEEPEVRASSRKSSFVNRLKGLGSDKDNRPMKVVRMPRGEYLKYFAKDDQYNYVGTEPQREWTAAELDEKFRQYQDLPPTAWTVNVPSGLCDTPRLGLS